MAVDRKNGGRLIIVGDRFQSIYGFAGADVYSFNSYEKIPNIIKYPLTITFRCAKEIVNEARKIVPDIKSTDNAIQGIVRKGSVLEEVKDGDFILSRKREPLIALLEELLSLGKNAIIKDSDFRKELLKLTEKGKSVKDVLNKLENSVKRILNKLIDEGVMDVDSDIRYMREKDKFNVMRILSDGYTDIQDLESKIKATFSKKGKAITLMTVHKSKGLEANRVFIIHPHELPMKTQEHWQYLQEMNLRYVAITRAKKELIWDHTFRVDQKKVEL
jgi:superfamily I DNA/RNA helicase